MGVEEKFVAVWVGKFQTGDELERYIEEHYDEDEDMDSAFRKSFGIEYFDDGLMEVNMLNLPENSWRELFAGSSYLDGYIDHLDNEKKEPFNVIVRIYDYKYTGEKQEDQYNGNSLRFYGNIRYKKIVDLSWMGL